MKKLGISIDGILRDFHGQFDKQYKKVFVHNPNLVGMTKDFQVSELSEEQSRELAEKMEDAIKERISYPIDTFNMLNHYKFEDLKMFENENSFSSEGGQFEEFLKENEFKLDEIVLEDKNTDFTPEEALDYFMYDKYPFQIFGDADVFKRAGEKFNQLQAYGLENNLFETVLLTNLKGQAISATYFFLHKAGCRARNIKVVNENVDKWKECDVLIDVDPEVLQNKPDGKTIIKINRDYNKWDKVDYSYDELFDVVQARQIFEKLFKK